MGCDGLAWLLRRCFLLIPLYLRCVEGNPQLNRAYMRIWDSLCTLVFGELSG
jgi:hypothetical protein